MNYSIGEMARATGLSASTLRYYDKEGLLPDVQRRGGGIRRFDQRSLEALRVIECLKKSGMEIRDIRQFMEWCALGPETYEKRLALFRRRKQELEQELEQMRRSLAMIDFKCWYYTRALENGNEDFAAAIPEGLPPDIRALYDASHKGSPAPAGPGEVQ